MEQTISFKSDLSNISLVENLVDNISNEIGLSDEIYGNVLLSMVEATNNAIIHGNNLDPNKIVKLTYTYQKGVLSITVKDEGLGFDFLNLPDPLHPDNIEKIDGRGLFLIRNLADELDFSNKGTCITIKFNL